VHNCILHSVCTTTAHRVHNNCTPCAQQLHIVCTTTAHRVHNCILCEQQLHTVRTTTAHCVQNSTCAHTVYIHCTTSARCWLIPARGIQALHAGVLCTRLCALCTGCSDMLCLNDCTRCVCTYYTYKLRYNACTTCTHTHLVVILKFVVRVRSNARLTAVQRIALA